MASTFRDAFDIGNTLTRGFEALKAAPWPILLGALLMQCTEGGGPGGGGGSPGGSGSGGDGSGGGEDWQGAGSWLGDLHLPSPEHLTGNIGAAEVLLISFIVLVVLAVTLVCTLALFALRTWVEVGYLRVQREALDTGAGRFETLFGGSDRFWSMAGYKLLSGVIALGTCLLAMLPGGAVLAAGLVMKVTLVTIAGAVLMALVVLGVAFYIGLGLALGRHAVALEGLCTVEAIERSWELVRGHRLWLAVYLLVLGIIHMAGICLCCFGVVLTRALKDTALTAAYLDLTRGASSEGRAQAIRP